jgi:glucose/mannose-6-phosphate isomerase
VSPTSAHQLDNPQTYVRLDPDSMGPLIAALGDQVREAWATGRDWPLPASFTTPSRVVVVGMGGSAIGADIASTLARISSPIPVEVVHNYTVPPAATGTLVIASSVSGNTEETLAAYEVARAGPGRHLAITTGGELAKLDGPCLTYEWGFHPRAALGWALMPLASVLTQLGVLSIADAEVQATAAALDANSTAWAINVPAEENRAKQIALRLHGRLPVIVGTDFLEVAARRWAGQLQENAKQWAFSAALPEMNHNFINGLGLPSPGIEQLQVEFLDAPELHARNRQRVVLTGQLLDEAGIANEVISTEATNPLETILRAAHLGGWVSFYLAMLNEVDPSDTSPIETFKERMG